MVLASFKKSQVRLLQTSLATLEAQRDLRDFLNKVHKKIYFKMPQVHKTTQNTSNFWCYVAKSEPSYLSAAFKSLVISLLLESYKKKE